MVEVEPLGPAPTRFCVLASFFDLPHRRPGELQHGHLRFGVFLDHLGGPLDRGREPRPVLGVLPFPDDVGRDPGGEVLAAARRFGSKSEIVSHLPAGAVLELSAPSVPDELVERVIAGEVPASPAAIRREKASDRSEERDNERAYGFGGTFIDYLGRFDGDRYDYAAGVAAHVIRRWKDPEHRAWFARLMRTAGEMIEENMEMQVPLLEFPRTTARKIKEGR